MASHATVTTGSGQAPYQSPPRTPQPAEQAATPDHLRRNSDPALEPVNQHQHAHLHHATGVAEDNIVYAKGTGPQTIPPQSHLHHHDDTRASSEHDIEKAKLGGQSPPEYANGEKVGVIAHDDERSSEHQPSKSRTFYRRYRPFFHLFIFLLFTGWWIAGLVLHRDDMNWRIPFLVWLAISMRLFFFYVRSSYLSRPVIWAWSQSAVRVYDALPPKARTPAGAAVTIAAMIVGSMASEEFADNNRENRAVSLFGLAFTIFALWGTSRNRKMINWRPVIGGMLAQFIIALFVLRTGAGYDIFKFIADRAGDLLGFAAKGVIFLTNDKVYELGYFIINVLPPIIFFVAIVQVLYYIGFLQWFIGKVATFIFWALQVSGAEAVVAAATPFIGQGESALLVRPFVPHMTNAELHQILTCGFATISGSVLVAYIGLGLNAQAMVSSCVMSIPASLAISKLRYPEVEETLTAGKVVVPDDEEHAASNAIHAFANGAWLGIKIAGSIMASLLCILAFVGLVDGLLTWWGRFLNINSPPLTLNLIAGYLFYPLAFLLGVPRNSDLLNVSRLIAEKVIINEYSAFLMLKNEAPYNQMSPRSILISTYALCGFGNIGSLGIQIGILSQLAPSRAGDVAKLAVSALACGVISTLTSAAVAGLVITQWE
ncbi:sodium/nucleoside cotransporter [Verticillium alfalfae VaMs.102]|uniref:Sodium/nucleoside cotransporter n=1 Tax=Verticillium alfalfae (strain VaMs.102 / ATCC MYA-4576 / FGSC 10136) TaxID=526221 RepID=C9SVP6_VERA1|nr:sodium/nucleoside cotransporter [Verticillium alfalfae VaMs.102]EEY22861.1 sodium/nucleoside cotransporter [Verticillium alfalfae VaMs.102]